MQLEDLVAGSQRVQLGPPGRIFEGIVRAIVGTPSDDVPKVAALVVVLREERPHGRRAFGENPPFDAVIQNTAKNATDVKLAIADATGKPVRQLSVLGGAGIRTAGWGLRGSGLGSV